MRRYMAAAALAAALAVCAAMCGCVDSGGRGEMTQEQVAKMVESFPDRDIRLICPPKQGGLSDFITRTLARYTEEETGANIVVENRPGNAGATGMRFGAQADPDGYTVTYVTVESTILKHRTDIDETVSYGDFELLARLNYGPASVSVKADSQWESFEDFASYSKKHSGEVNIGTSGQYSIWHLAAAVMADSLGTGYGYVPYDGAAPSVQDLLGGHLDAVVSSPSEVFTFVRAGQLRMLAVLGDERVDEFPDVPTAAELGYDIDVGAWGGLGVPRGTPEEIRRKLIDMFSKGFNNPGFQQKCAERSAGLNWLDAAEFSSFAARQDEMFARILKNLDM